MPNFGLPRDLQLLSEKANDFKGIAPPHWNRFLPLETGLGTRAKALAPFGVFLDIVGSWDENRRLHVPIRWEIPRLCQAVPERQQEFDIFGSVLDSLIGFEEDVHVLIDAAVDGLWRMLRSGPFGPFRMHGQSRGFIPR